MNQVQMQMTSSLILKYFGSSQGTAIHSTRGWLLLISASHCSLALPVLSHHTIWVGGGVIGRTIAPQR